jgi:UrcA family protein
MRNLLTNTACAVASVALTTGIVAFADPANASIVAIDAVPSVVVQTSDLDLRSDAGQAAAHRRVRRAVDRVCGADGRDLGQAACRAQALETATRALDIRTAAL